MSPPLDQLEREAQAGRSWAQFNLALQYFSGQGLRSGRRDYKQAARWFLQAALQGDEKAQTNLAFMLEEGLGITQNTDQALSWYLQAAQRGDQEAQFQLGLRFLHGRSVPRDQDRGLKWIQFAAVQNHTQAQALLGDWYSLGAAKNSEERKYKKIRGTDLDKSIHWYRKAAQSGNAHSQYRLGFLLYHGRGAPANPGEARDWLEKAAQQGYLEAQYLLGRFYSGSSHRDLVQAYAWFQSASFQGLERASEAMRALRSRLNPEEIERAREFSSKLRRP